MTTKNEKNNHPNQAIELLDQYFPKGSKKRGEVMAILSLAWIEGRQEGKIQTEERHNQYENK